jgi:hypothetical protein
MSGAIGSNSQQKIGFHFESANASLKIDGKKVNLADAKTITIDDKAGGHKEIQGFIAQDGTIFQVKQGDKAKNGGVDIIVRGTPEQLASYDFGVKNGSVTSARYGENSYRPGGEVAAHDFTIQSGTSGEEILKEHGLSEKPPKVSKDPEAPVINKNNSAASGRDHTKTDTKKLQQETSDAITANRDRMREMMKGIPLVTADRKAPSSPQSTAKTDPQPSVEIPKMEAHSPVKDDVENPRIEEVPYDPKPSDIEQLEGIPLPFARARSGNNGQVDSEKPLVEGENPPGPSVPSKAATAEAKLPPKLREQLSELRERIGSLPEGDKGKDLAGVLDGAIMSHDTERTATASETGPASESFRKAFSEYKELKQTHGSAIAELTAMLKNQQGKTLKPADLTLQQEKTVELRVLTASLQESREKLEPLQRDAQNLLSRRDRNDRNLESVMGMVSNRLDDLGIQNPSMAPGNIQIREDYFAAPSVVEGARTEKKEDSTLGIPEEDGSIENASTRMATDLGELDFEQIESDVALLEELENLGNESTDEDGNISESSITLDEMLEANAAAALNVFITEHPEYREQLEARFLDDPLQSQLEVESLLNESDTGVLESYFRLGIGQGNPTSSLGENESMASRNGLRGTLSSRLFAEFKGDATQIQQRAHADWNQLRANQSSMRDVRQVLPNIADYGHVPVEGTGYCSLTAMAAYHGMSTSELIEHLRATASTPDENRLIDEMLQIMSTESSSFEPAEDQYQALFAKAGLSFYVLTRTGNGNLMIASVIGNPPPPNSNAPGLLFTKQLGNQEGHFDLLRHGTHSLESGLTLPDDGNKYVANDHRVHNRQR